MTTTKPQSALEPCPFCGGVAVLGMFNIWCARCEAQIRKDVDAAPDDMIKRWNARAPASAAPVVDEQALKKRARQVIDAVVKSPCVVEVRFFSQPEESEKLENEIAALITPAAATAAPQQELRQNPRVNAMLVALRKVRDNAPTLEAAQSLATIAIEEYVDTAALVEQSEIDLDPLEFWCDLMEVLGHPRPVKVNPASVIAEVGERLRRNSNEGAR